jgi:preprotein translocase subunit SecG
MMERAVSASNRARLNPVQTALRSRGRSQVRTKMIARMTASGFARRTTAIETTAMEKKRTRRSEGVDAREKILMIDREGEEKEEHVRTRMTMMTMTMTMMMMMQTTQEAFADVEAVMKQSAANQTLESVRLGIAVTTCALILFQGPKGDGVVNTLSEKRVFSSAKNAKSAVDYVTYALIGGFIVLSGVLAVG